MADLIPDEAWVHIVGAYGYDESAEDWPRLKAALEAAAPHILAAELDRLIADPDNYAAGGAFRPIVLVHRLAELRSTEGDTIHG